MEVKSIFVVMIYKERAQYQAALRAFDNRDNAEKLVQNQVMQGDVRSWVEEIPAHFKGEPGNV